MTILERLERDMIAATKAREAERLRVIRYVRSEAKNREIELGRPLDDSDVVEVLARLAKKHRESIEQFEKGRRDDLVGRERRALAVIEEYLPAPLDEKELAAVVDEILAAVGAKGPGDLGAVMRAIMPKVRGRAEGAVVRAMVAARLEDMPKS